MNSPTDIYAQFQNQLKNQYEGELERLRQDNLQVRQQLQQSELANQKLQQELTQLHYKAQSVEMQSKQIQDSMKMQMGSYQSQVKSQIESLQRELQSTLLQNEKLQAEIQQHSRANLQLNEELNQRTLQVREMEQALRQKSEMLEHTQQQQQILTQRNQQQIEAMETRWKQQVQAVSEQSRKDLEKLTQQYQQEADDVVKKYMVRFQQLQDALQQQKNQSQVENETLTNQYVLKVRELENQKDLQKQEIFKFMAQNEELESRLIALTQTEIPQLKKVYTEQLETLESRWSQRYQDLVNQSRGEVQQITYQYRQEVGEADKKYAQRLQSILENLSQQKYQLNLEYENQIANFQQKIKELQSEKDSLKEELLKYQSLAQDLDSRLRFQNNNSSNLILEKDTQLQNLQKQAQETINKLSIKNYQYESQIIELSDQLNRLQQENQKYNIMNQQMIIEINNLNQKNEELNAISKFTNEEKDNELKFLRQKDVDQQFQIKQLRQNLSDYEGNSEGTITKLSEAIIDFQDEIKSLNISLSQSQQAYQTISDQIIVMGEEHENALNRWRTRYLNLEAQNGKLQAQRVLLLNEIDSTMLQFKDVELNSTTVKKITKDLQNMSQRYELLNRNYKRLGEDKSLIDSQRADSSQVSLVKKDYEEIISQVRAELEKQKQQNKNLMDEIQNYRGQMTTLKSSRNDQQIESQQINSLKAELEGLRKENALLKSQIKKLEEQDQSENNKRTADQQRQIRQLTKQLEQAKIDIQEVNKQHLQQVSILEREKDFAVQEGNQLKEQISQNIKSVRNLQDLEQLKEKLATTERQLSSARQQVEKLKNELNINSENKNEVQQLIKINSELESDNILLKSKLTVQADEIQSLKQSNVQRESQRSNVIQGGDAFFWSQTNPRINLD